MVYHLKKKTSIKNILQEYKFIFNKINNNKYGYYYEYIDDNKKIIFLTQSGFKQFFNIKFNIKIHKNPDEAFIIIKNETYTIKILEKKNQNVEGSVEDKLKTGAFNRNEYTRIFKKYNFPKEYNIHYAFCISNFLKNKFESNDIKYIIMKEIMKEDNIDIFYGEDENYFSLLLEWIELV